MGGVSSRKSSVYIPSPELAAHVNSSGRLSSIVGSEKSGPPSVRRSVHTGGDTSGDTLCPSSKEVTSKNPPPGAPLPTIQGSDMNLPEAIVEVGSPQKQQAAGRVPSSVEESGKGSTAGSNVAEKFESKQHL